MVFFILDFNDKLTTICRTNPILFSHLLLYTFLGVVGDCGKQFVLDVDEAFVKPTHPYTHVEWKQKTKQMVSASGQQIESTFVCVGVNVR